jgi:hypothetical protein
MSFSQPFQHSHNHQTVRKRSFGRGKIERIGRVLVPIQDQRGFNNEDIVEKILAELREEELIRHFYRTERWSRSDRHGIDFVVVKNDSSRIILNAKSSQRKVDEFNERKERFKDNKRYDGVYAVLVKTDYLVNDRPFKEAIKKILGL